MSEFTPIHEPPAEEREIYAALRAVQWFHKSGLIVEATRELLTNELLDQLANPTGHVGSLIYAETKQQNPIYDQETES